VSHQVQEKRLSIRPFTLEQVELLIIHIARQSQAEDLLKILDQILSAKADVEDQVARRCCIGHRIVFHIELDGEEIFRKAESNLISKEIVDKTILERKEERDGIKVEWKGRLKESDRHQFGNGSRFPA
jgi:hypothetical protein